MTALTMTADALLDESHSPARRHLLLALGLAAFAAVIAAGWGTLELSGQAPVARIQIEGRLVRIKAADVDAAIRPLVDRRFGELDLPAAQRAVEALPWTARASVERVWPATVRVRIWEREPFARWGEHALLDSEARAYTPQADEIPDGLPRLAGPAGKEGEVATMFRSLSARLIASSFALQGLAQDARGEWSARTAGGVELRFGRSDPQDKLEMLLGPAERVLKNRMTEVKYVDLRYTNGFSVGWLDPAKANTKEER